MVRGFGGHAHPRSVAGSGRGICAAIHAESPMFVGGGAEFFDIVLSLHGLGTFSEELRNCVDVTLGRHKLKVLRVDRILASKRAANRAKDRLAISALETIFAPVRLAMGTASAT